MAYQSPDYIEVFPPQTFEASNQDIQSASLSLMWRYPELSFYREGAYASRGREIALILALIAISAPYLCLLILYYAGLMLLYAALLMQTGLLALHLIGHTKRKLTALPDLPDIEKGEAWPHYSVIIPLYKEAPSIVRLVQDMKALRYPEDRLEVIFLLEEKDGATLDALVSERLPAHWRLFVLPDGHPRTKPRALNVALKYIKGTYVTVYDAEDTPHPDQLSAALQCFLGADAGLACVQAPLVAHNGLANWLSGQWALEYRVHFGLWLPALAHMRLPIALGGTSNHFRVDILKSLAGWDAWNVTEDADLGLRLARFGYHIAMINLPTLEEAPESLNIWLPQRSRWLKGYLQTLSVLWRTPIKAGREMGYGAFVISQVNLLSSVFSAFIHGPSLFLCFSALIFPDISLGALGWPLLILSLIVTMSARLLAPGPRTLRRIFLVLTSPIYFPLHSLAAYRAGYELFTKPCSWAKTPHGLCNQNAAVKAALFAQITAQ